MTDHEFPTYCELAVSSNIARQTGAPEWGYPFLNHPWSASDSDRAIADGVLATPRRKYLRGVVSGEGVKEDIWYPRNLIGATGKGSLLLGQEPEKPLPL